MNKFSLQTRLVFGFGVLGLIALVLNLSGSGNNTPGMPNGYLPQEHARHPITPMFPGAAATAEAKAAATLASPVLEIAAGALAAQSHHAGSPSYAAQCLA